MFGNKREQRIRARAYILAEQAGFPTGRDLDFWDQARRLEPRWSWPGRVRGWLSTQKDAIATIQAVATVLGARCWRLVDVVAFRPCCSASSEPLRHSVRRDQEVRPGLTAPSRHFRLENTGRTTAFLTCAALIVSRVVPANDQQLKWLSGDVRDVLKTPSPNWQVLKWEVDDSLARDDFFVEVGNHTQYTADFILPDMNADNGSKKLSTVQIYSNFQRAIPGNNKCRRKPNGGIEGPGWGTTTLYDLPS